MIPDFDPRRYPGPRPPGPVLIHDGAVHPLRVDGPSHAPVRPVSAGPATRSLPAMVAPGDLRWSVAYGSNASPGRLVAKGLDRHGAVLLPARLAGFAPAFEHRHTGYGSVPLTLVPTTGAVHDTWVLGLPADATDLLDRTEGRIRGAAPPTPGPETGDGRFAPPGTYQLAHVGGVTVADRFVLPSGLAYLPGPATKAQVTEDGRWRTWPAWDQGAAATHVEVDGPNPPAPEVEEPVLGDWPATPLRDLPLFVYGTLRPDGSAFGHIAHLVEVSGPATTPGVLFDTGRGWPAAAFDGLAAGVSEEGSDRGSGPRTIRGYLLAARGPEQARHLFDLVDRYEEVPELFRRTSVLVEGPEGRCWAASYVWSGGSPPGGRISRGEWVVR